MQDRLIDGATAILYAIAAISGGLGGCMVAAHKVLRGRSVTAVLVVAYLFAGAIFGLAGVIGLRIFAFWVPTVETTILAGLMFGVIGAGALMGMNLSARFIMRRFGIEVDVQVRRVKRNGQ